MALKSKDQKNLTPALILEKAVKSFGIIGREAEIKKLALALLANRNVLIEGPVGVGKTALAQTVAQCLGRNVIRVDGDTRFTEQKLTGWFDPSQVMKKGFVKKSFMAGPLVSAMETGSILFINELNRMPEAVQNVLLPAIDEGIVSIPQLGLIKAKPGFLLVATQNPREFVATSHLSEALLDRMEWLPLGYQSSAEELEIVKRVTGFHREPFLSLTVALVRLTRNHIKIKRGASVRAAIAIAQVLKVYANEAISEEDFLEVVRLSLPTRIEFNSTEFDGGIEQQIAGIILELWNDVKKKT